MHASPTHTQKPNGIFDTFVLIMLEHYTHFVPRIITAYDPAYEFHYIFSFVFFMNIWKITQFDSFA